MRWIGWVALIGCTGDMVEPEETGMPMEETDNPDPGPSEDLSASLEVSVVDANGAAVSGADVRFCRGPECRFATADDNGEFGFTKVAVDWHSLEVIAPVGDTSRLATAFAPVIFETETIREVDFVMPSLDAAVTLPGTAAPLAVGTGLTIELAAGDLKPPTFVPDAKEVAGVRLTEDQWVPVDGEEGTVVAQWFLDPFDHHALVDIPMTFANDYGLKDGSTLSVIVGDYITSTWLDAGTLTVEKGELVGTVNLPVTSTVVLLDTTPAK
ncbi:MAG: carboxypeptidase-like regulatory domain-containing protein [Myxococcota bacterium]